MLFSVIDIYVWVMAYKMVNEIFVTFLAIFNQYHSDEKSAIGMPY